MQVRPSHALAGSGHSLYGRIVSPDRIAAGYETRCRSSRMGPVPTCLAASRMGPAQVGIRVCPLAFCPRCWLRCDRRQWTMSPGEAPRQETVRLGRPPAWYGPPGTRTQNPRLKRPLLCQIELEARTARKYNIHAVQAVAFRLGSYRLPADRSGDQVLSRFPGTWPPGSVGLTEAGTGTAGRWGHDLRLQAPASFDPKKGSVCLLRSVRNCLRYRS